VLYQLSYLGLMYIASLPKRPYFTYMYADCQAQNAEGFRNKYDMEGASRAEGLAEKRRVGGLFWGDPGASRVPQAQ
jgi:hypothetical protein